MPVAPGVLFCPICCPAAHDMAAVETKRMASRVLISEPQAQRRFQTAHGIGCNWETELCTVHHRNPAGEDAVVEQVRCVHASIQIEAPIRSKGTCKRGIQTELIR